LQVAIISRDLGSEIARDENPPPFFAHDPPSTPLTLTLPCPLPVMSLAHTHSPTRSDLPYTPASVVVVVVILSLYFSPPGYDR